MKKIISLILVAIMLLSISSIMAYAADGDYKLGDLIEYGNYPQSKVEENTEEWISLEKMEKNWVSYRYYSYTYTAETYLRIMADGKMEPGDFAFFADLDTDADGKRDYRAVMFEKRRNGVDNGFLENGYKTKTVYYFRYEPIVWKILDPSDGLIISKYTLDSQPFNSFCLKSGIVSEDGRDAYWGNPEMTYYANDYYNSSIRKWLNEDFYNTAFTESQSLNIRNDVLLNNDCFDKTAPHYNSKSCKDKIFFLSYDEALKTEFGFSAESYFACPARMAMATDYSKSQGIEVDEDGFPEGAAYAWYWLRTPAYLSLGIRDISFDGYIGGTASAYNYQTGVRPVCRLVNLTADKTKTDLGNNIGTGLECTHSDVIILKGTASTCVSPGISEGKKCALCGEIIVEQVATDMINHIDDDNNGICDECGSEIDGYESEPVHETFGERIINFFKGLVDSILAMFKRLFG